MKLLREVNWLHVVLACLIFWLLGIGPALLREAHAMDLPRPPGEGRGEGSLLKAGSGNEPRMAECQRVLFDEYVIADARLREVTRDDLIAKANENLAGERLTNVLKLIELAYASADVKAWFQEKWFACLNAHKVSQSEEWLKGRQGRCKEYGLWALRLRYDRTVMGLPWEKIIVDPDEEPFKQRVMELDGVPTEKLYDAIVGDCMGSAT